MLTGYISLREGQYAPHGGKAPMMVWKKVMSLCMLKEKNLIGSILTTGGTHKMKI